MAHGGRWDAAARPFRCDSQLIQIYGTDRVVFEACRRVLEYNEGCILLEGAVRVKICGRHLQLRELGGGVLAAVGTIESLSLERRGGRRAR